MAPRERTTADDTTVMTVRNVPTMLRDALRVLAAQEKKTMAELMIEGAYLRVANGAKPKPTQAELLARYAGVVPAPGAIEEADEFFAAVRAQSMIE